jgi:preprotein translocase subunit YajC
LILQASGIDAVLLEVAVLALFLAALFVVLVLPQLRNLRRHRETIAGLSAGDRIVTNGGLVGVVVELIDHRFAEVQFGDGIVMRVKTDFIYEKTAN